MASSIKSSSSSTKGKPVFYASDAVLFRRRSSIAEPTKEILLKCKKFGKQVNLLKWQFGFIAALGIIWTVGLAGYLSLVDPFKPRMWGSTGIPTPGLAIRPRPDNPYSTLISFRHGGSGNWQPLVKRFKDFLKQYGFGKRPDAENIACTWDTQLTDTTRCGIGNRKWMALDTDIPCVGPEKFGMYHGQPCIIVKMNRVLGWEPEPYYNLTEINSLDMPVWLKEYVGDYWTKHCRGKGQDVEDKCPQMRMIWLSCSGETAADEENAGKIHYVPWQGFPGYHFPYLNQQHYLSPLIWIQFRSITPGTVIQIRCKIWAKNIEHSALNPRKGGIHFELLMD